jgi:hypothetical protein
MMALNRPRLIVLATATLILTGCQVMPRSTGPSLGELEHRGHRYALRDLNSQAYRDASNDPFVRKFNPETAWARKDASRGLRAVPMSANVLDSRR